MRKILILITKGDIGGAQTFVLNLANGLNSNGYDVTVGIGNSKNPTFLEKEIRKSNIEIKKFQWLSRGFSPIRGVFFIFEIIKYLNRERFDVVQLNSSNSLIAAMASKFSKSKPKIIFTFHGLSFVDQNCRNFLKRFVIMLVYKFLSGFVNKKVFVSKNNHSYALKIGLADDKYSSVIYNGSECSFLTKKEAVEFFEEKIGIKLKEKKIIGSIGRLAYPKNYEFLIKSARNIVDKNSNIVFIIVGNGPKKEKYEQIVSKNGLKNKVFFIGEVEAACKYLKAFDIFTLVSVYEGLSITLIDALMAKVPILASNVGGNNEIIGEDAGKTFKLNNEKDFVEKLDNIINSSSKNFSASASHIKKFSRETMIQNYIKTINQLITN